ncbi:hypothetical protein ILYODFUR_001808 [Ilyodon furcidens]|uniref:Uncharacterized protein n=1 Tax=Ilyodon furcidens TaxID=33524 RepID=A0ABV0T5L0_9TELE
MEQGLFPEMKGPLNVQSAGSRGSRLTSSICSNAECQPSTAGSLTTWDGTSVGFIYTRGSETLCAKDHI